MKHDLKVMADFSSSGLWDLKTGLMLDEDDVRLPKKIWVELEEWVNYYDTCFKGDYSTFKPNKSKKLNDWGREITLKIRDILPAKTTVAFVVEDEKGIRDPEIVGRYIFIKGKKCPRKKKN